MSNETQLQNEALIRLLIAARYQDSKLSLAESESLQKYIEALPWDSGTGKSVFVNRETARVRETLSTEGKKQEFLNEQCSYFTSPETRAAVLKALEAVLKSDGIDPKESKFLSHIAGILKK